MTPSPSGGSSGPTTIASTTVAGGGGRRRREATATDVELRTNVPLAGAAQLADKLRNAIRGIDVAKFGAVQPTLSAASDGTAAVHLSIERPVNCAEVKQLAESVKQQVAEVSGDDKQKRARPIVSRCSPPSGDRDSHQLWRQEGERLSAAAVVFSSSPPPLCIIKSTRTADRRLKAFRQLVC